LEIAGILLFPSTSAKCWRCAIFGALLLGATLRLEAAELVHLDRQGVIRWTADQSEVALFGANYCLPSACDYRAAGYVGADRKRLVEQDMLHLARMGWDGMRLCFWGDWENCDDHGNLIDNDHLDLMDYAIAQARDRGIYILFTPITTYAAWWPDGASSDEYPGFSQSYSRADLGRDPVAISAQSNYVHQILNHVNRYTRVALKDEPSVLFIEMINEPVHRPDELSQAIQYIDTLVDAVRSTGCSKLLFHNVSQDFRITPAIKASKVQGVSFAWYPTGLNVNRSLKENYLRTVDAFPPMLRPDLLQMPKIVYEFDSPDVNSGYMYPAMVRSFREVGAQFVAMFSYDMLDTAPYNLGWQTHFLNLVYSPRKAVSAIIAAEATRELPRYSHHDDYPDNRRFGPFRVSYEEDTSEMVTRDSFLYANDTFTRPPELAALKRIVGLGSSPIVEYEGCGAYFLDKLGDGVWRLELYPDAVIVMDPFSQKLNHESACSRLVWREWPMTIRLPDLGESFWLKGLNAGNATSAQARAGNFQVKPGVYLLTREPEVNLSRLPQQVGHVGLTEFVCPAAPRLPAQILAVARETYPADGPIVIGADVVDSAVPESVTLFVRPAGGGDFQDFPLEAKGGYRHEVRLPAGSFKPSAVEYYLTARMPDGEVRFPMGSNETATAEIIAAATPLVLFDAQRDIDRLVFTRIGDGIRQGIFERREATPSEPATLRLFFPLSYDWTLDDYTASVSVKQPIIERRSHLHAMTALRVRAKGESDGQIIHLTLVEADGTSWGVRLTLSAQWQEITVPVEDFELARGVMLPLGFPGRWNYWLTPAGGRGHPQDRLKLESVEHLQISFRPSGEKPDIASDPWVDVASVALVPTTASASHSGSPELR